MKTSNSDPKLPQSSIAGVEKLKFKLSSLAQWLNEPNQDHFIVLFFG